VVNRRLAAVASLVLLAASVVLAVVVAVQSFPRGLTVLACVGLALLAAWWALVDRAVVRFVAAAGACVLLAGAVVLVVLEGRVLEDVLILAGLLLSLAAARSVFNDTILDDRVRPEASVWLSAAANIEIALSSLVSVERVLVARVADITPDWSQDHGDGRAGTGNGARCTRG
jgi:hypothetical protein